MIMSMIAINNIIKYYGKVCALDNISLTFESNKIYGLLGRNGAGKTTLLNLISNRLFPTSGAITIDGESVVENDRAIGKVFYTNEKNFYPEGMTIKKIFKWTKEFYPSFNIDYAYGLCDKFSLNLGKKIKALSTGYNSISKLVCTLASDAEILIFDEPILGLDAHHRDLFYKELIANYIEKPKTIILSTHIIDEVADVFEKVIILKDKNVIVDNNVETLLKTAYCVSGSSESIDKFIINKNCVNIDQLATFKAATIIGEINHEDQALAAALNLQFTEVELQKLFIYLTNVRGEKY